MRQKNNQYFSYFLPRGLSMIPIKNSASSPPRLMSFETPLNPKKRGASFLSLGWRLTAGSWLLAAGCYLLAADCWLLTWGSRGAGEAAVAAAISVAVEPQPEQVEPWQVEPQPELV